MGVEGPVRMAAPNFRIPRLLGIFSVVFATGLLLGGICMGGYVAIMPLVSGLMQSTQSRVSAQLEASRKAELNALAEREKKAKTDDEKIDLAAERKVIETRPLAPMNGMMDVNRVQMGDPSFLRYSWADVVSGIVLNVLLLISGIGLLSWRPWARRLAVWTAALKIVRLVGLYGFFIIVIVPPYCQKLGKAVDAMMQTTGLKSSPFMNAQALIKVYTVMYSAMGLGVMLLGVIFPAILLWFLTRPAVKSACSGLLKLPPEPGQPS